MLEDDSKEKIVSNPSRFTESDFLGAEKFTSTVAELRRIRCRIHNALPYIHPIYYDCQGLPEKGISKNTKTKTNSLDSESDEMPTGWSRFTGRWNRLLNSLCHLRIRDGYTLAAFLYFDGMGGNSVIYGIPEKLVAEQDPSVVHGKNPMCNISIPSPYMIDSITGDSNESCGTPKIPKKGVRKYMSLFSGDGTPESYLEASILYQELMEFGAYWHGVRWAATSLESSTNVRKEINSSAQDCIYIHPSLQSGKIPSKMIVPMVMKTPKRIACRWVAHTGYLRDRVFYVWSVFESPSSMEMECDDEILVMHKGGFIY